MTLVKICGLMRHEDVDYVNHCKPEMAGFIMCPGFRRTRSVSDAEMMVRKLSENISSVGVFMDQPLEQVSDIVKEVGFNLIQLHGDEDDEYIKKLRNLTGKRIIKSFKVKSREDIVRAEGSAADMILLDGGAGDGKTFDWSLIGSSKREYILAGGLTPENVGDAVSTLHPFAVDTSSGVETEQFKDEQKIRGFIRAVRTAEGN